MSRDISTDFKGLIKFFKEYNLSDFDKNISLREDLTKQHKKYFSLLTFLAELKNQKSPELSQLQVEYLMECCSDIGNALFLMAHGAYKASRMMLRSSIETFLKGFNLDIMHHITEEKSMYKLFDDIKGQEFFKDENSKPIINVIHSNYKELCKDIHTASLLNMQKLTALQYFPSFDRNCSSSIADLSVKLTTNYLILLTIKYKSAFLQMHHRNQENILGNIPKKFRKLVLGV